MAIPDLPKELLEGGREYFQQLKLLGLRPEGLLWVNRSTDDAFILWLIWSGIDRVGPLEVGNLLFKAYNAALLSQKIDPFVVEVRSRRELVAKMLLDQAKDKSPYNRVVIRDIASPNYDDTSHADHLRYTWHRDWIYHLQKRGQNSVELTKDWRRFSERVTSLAA